MLSMFQCILLRKHRERNSLSINKLHRYRVHYSMFSTFSLLLLTSKLYLLQITFSGSLSPLLLWGDLLTVFLHFCFLCLRQPAFLCMQCIALCLLPQGRLFHFNLCSCPHLLLLSRAQFSVYILISHSFLFLALWVWCDKYSRSSSPPVCSQPLSLGVLVQQHHVPAVTPSTVARRLQGWPWDK